ncbi:winged helix-turn-helix transcriptional regulator, partial [Faecalibaculum rodentium]
MIEKAIQENTQNGQFSRLSVAELSSQLSLPKSRVTQALQQLLKAGTIVRAGQK